MDEKKEEKTCEGCAGLCCKYVSIEIDVPEEIDDFEDIKWYVIHKNVNVYVDEDDEWYVEFLTPCEYVREDGKCSIHEDFTKNPEIKRPKICKEYSTDECPFYNKYKEKYTFKNIHDVENYIENVYKKGKHIIPEDEDEDEE